MKYAQLLPFKKLDSTFYGLADSNKKDMLGTDEAEKDGWKDLIVTRESTGPEFNFFYPHDDWQSKKKEESPQEVN